jgi:hypothetical protein
MHINISELLQLLQTAYYAIAIVTTLSRRR